jgi:hypothetical protein
MQPVFSLLALFVVATLITELKLAVQQSAYQSGLWATAFSPINLPSTD